MVEATSRPAFRYRFALNRVTLGMQALLFARLCSGLCPLRPATLRSQSANANYLMMRKSLFRWTNKRNRPTAISKSLMRFPMNVCDGWRRYDSTLDVASEPAELIPCPQCGRTFRGVKGLATHCRSMHGPLVQVTPGRTCPKCQKTFPLEAT